VGFWRWRVGHTVSAAIADADASPGRGPATALPPVLAPDAAPPPPPDAGALIPPPVKKPHVPPGPGKKPLALPVRPAPPDDPRADLIGTGPPVTVTVFVNPASGQLHALGGVLVPSGTAIRQPGGSRLTFSCSAADYRPGTVRVRFDGSMQSATCQLCSLTLKYPADHPCAR
jgi:hypothetical protein